MKYAEYVVTGWAVTGALVAGYWAWIVRRTRRAEQTWRASKEVDAG